MPQKISLKQIRYVTFSAHGQEPPFKSKIILKKHSNDKKSSFKKTVTQNHLSVSVWVWMSSLNSTQCIPHASISFSGLWVEYWNAVSFSQIRCTPLRISVMIRSFFGVFWHSLSHSRWFSGSSERLLSVLGRWAFERQCCAALCAVRFIAVQCFRACARARVSFSTRIWHLSRQCAGFVAGV